MKRSETGKRWFFCECFFEKCMEWFDYLRHDLIKRKTWVSNLIEYYCIYEEYIDKDFVKEFLNERKKILDNNRYKMEIKVLQERGDKNTIGKVELYCKKRFIHRATLKIKGDEERGDKLIFWSFDNKQ